MVNLVHPKRWASIGISVPIQILGGDELSKLIPAIPPGVETSVASNLDSQDLAAAVSAAAPASASLLSDPIQVSTEAEAGSTGTTLPNESPMPDSAKSPKAPSETSPVQEARTFEETSQPEKEETGDQTSLPDAATPPEPEPETPPEFNLMEETRPPEERHQPSPDTEKPSTLTAQRSQHDAKEDETQPVPEETSRQLSAPDAAKPSETLAVQPPQKESQPASDLEAPRSTPVKVEEEEYIPQDLKITYSHTYSSTEYSLSYTEDEFAPFALLQPGMFCDDGMNLVIRVRILTNDYYNPNRGNAGSEVGSIYGSSNASIPPPPPTIQPMLSSVSSSFVPSLPPVSEAEPLSFEVTCRRALVQQIVDLDKKIAALSSDIAADILKKEIEALNEGLEQLSATQGAKKVQKVKGALAALIKRRQ